MLWCTGARITGSLCSEEQVEPVFCYYVTNGKAASFFTLLLEYRRASPTLFAHARVVHLVVPGVECNFSFEKRKIEPRNQDTISPRASIVFPFKILIYFTYQPQLLLLPSSCSPSPSPTLYPILREGKASRRELAKPDISS